MTTTENMDADGYPCEFEDDIPDVERKFYLKVYPKIDLVVERRVHCTSCGNHIGTAPISEAIVRMHPVLKVTQCGKCHKFYNSGEFEKGEDGSELYCRWCGQGGEVYCCAKCPYVFCKSCIVQNLSRGCVNDIAKNETWNCFSCAPKIMWHLRAQHWALVNFMEKQKKKLAEQNLTEEELNEQMSQDLSTCCKNKPKKSITPGQKRPSSILKLPTVMAKKPLLDKSSKMAANMKKMAKQTSQGAAGGSEQEVVCTPDIFSMFSQNDEPAPVVRPTPPPPRPVAAPARVEPPPLHMRQFGGAPSLQATQRSIQQQIAQQQQQQSIQLTLPAGFGTGANPSPVYHTINGYRIDLNSAAQQDTFRLPNGKLIQVKKQIPGAAQMTPQQMQAQLQQQINPSNVTARTTYPPSANVMPNNVRARAGPQSMHQQMNPVRPIGGNSTYVSVRYNQSQQANTATPARLLNGSMNLYPGNVHQHSAFQQQFQQQQQHHHQQLQQQQQQQAQQQATQQATQQAAQQAAQTQATVQPLIVIPRVQHPPTKLGKTRTHFEDKVFAGMEVCHQIIGKINTLTNSSSYKNVHNFRDLKELNIHLSYLFQYAMGRFKGLQEKVVDDIKSLAGVILETEANDKNADSDGDDLEILEPQTTLIELDSDDDSTTITTSGGPKAAAGPVVQVRVLSTLPTVAAAAPRTVPTVVIPGSSQATIRLLTRADSPVFPALPTLTDPKLKKNLVVSLPKAETIYPHLKSKLEAFTARLAERQQMQSQRPGPSTSKTVFAISDSDDDEIALSAVKAKTVKRKRKNSNESSESDWEKEKDRQPKKKRKKVKFADDRSNHSKSSKGSVDDVSETGKEAGGDAEKTDTDKDVETVEILDISDEQKSDDKKGGDSDLVELIEVSDKEDEATDEVAKVDLEEADKTETSSKEKNPEEKEEDNTIEKEKEVETKKVKEPESKTDESAPQELDSSAEVTAIEDDEPDKSAAEALNTSSDPLAISPKKAGQNSELNTSCDPLEICSTEPSTSAKPLENNEKDVDAAESKESDTSVEKGKAEEETDEKKNDKNNEESEEKDDKAELSETENDAESEKVEKKTAHKDNNKTENDTESEKVEETADKDDTAELNQTKNDAEPEKVDQTTDKAELSATETDAESKKEDETADKDGEKEEKADLSATENDKEEATAEKDDEAEARAEVLQNAPAANKESDEETNENGTEIVAADETSKEEAVEEKEEEKSKDEDKVSTDNPEQNNVDHSNDVGEEVNQTPPSSPVEATNNSENENVKTNGNSSETSASEQNLDLPEAGPVKDDAVKDISDKLVEAVVAAATAADEEPPATTANDQQLGLEDLIEHGLTSDDYGGFGNVPDEDWNSLIM